MTEIEGNKLIAEFMGYENLRSAKEYPLYKIPEHSYESINEEGVTELIDNFELNWDLCFHSSWDWIMPVYKKINKLIQLRSATDFVFSTETDRLHINIWNALEDENCLISELWIELVRFIEWYNKNKQ